MNVRAAIDRRIAAALSTCTGVETAALVNPTGKPEFGDYQANGVMAAAKRQNTNPRELADQVLEHLLLDDIASRLEVAGPGFINIFLSTDFLTLHLADDQPAISQEADPYTVVVDYSTVIVLETISSFFEV